MKNVAFLHELMLQASELAVISAALYQKMPFWSQRNLNINKLLA